MTINFFVFEKKNSNGEVELVVTECAQISIQSTTCTGLNEFNTFMVKLYMKSIYRSSLILATSHLVAKLMTFPFLVAILFITSIF